ncbi:MAG TPA: MYXO-CTERM sorting domain-containing protein [Sandaracinaceae bacterium LLY-WYZ-13_1]|nr:MYXO-CTERM sorting domain-containing protein [Sandaracinaceae bacterium LLY-WYZ-13_1]
MGTATRWSGRASSLALGGLLLLSAASAAAHGRPPVLGSLHAAPGDPSRLVARATWGLAISDDGGDGWRWLCSAVMGVDARNEDPALAVMEGGVLLAGTFEGLRRSTDGGCTWTRPSGALADVYVLDLWRVDARVALAVAAGPEGEDRLYRTEDAGRSWRPTAGRFGEVLVARVRTAPSDPSRVYASGAVPAVAGGERRAFVLRSDDGGASFEPFELPLRDGERQLQIWAVDPRDPDVLYGQVLHFDGEEAPERVVRSEDGGRGFETVLEIPWVGGLMVEPSGAVLAGSRRGGLWRAPDGRAFEPLDPELPVTCLARIGETRWACVDEARAGFALARADDGRRFEPAAGLRAMDTMVRCPRCSPAGIQCPAWAPDIAYDLGLDASLPAGFDPDGGTGAPRDAGLPVECGGEPPPEEGCRAAPGGTDGGLLWAVALALIGVHRVRRRRAREPAKPG